MFSDICPDISLEEYFDVCIVGGGTCGLAVAARLCEDTPGSIYTEDEHQRFHWLRNRKNNLGTVGKNAKKSTFHLALKFMASQILVLDAVSDSFLGQWDNQFATCQIPHLRSPMFFHPDPHSIDSMITYAHQSNRESDLMEIPNVVGREYSKHQQKRVMNKQRAKRPAPLDTEKNHDLPGIVDINMRDWRDYYRPLTKFFKDFCQDVVDRYDLGSCVRKDEVVSVRYGNFHIFDKSFVERGFIFVTASGKIYGSKICVVASGHRGKINFPLKGIESSLKVQNQLDFACHTTHIFNRATPFPPVKVIRKLNMRKKCSIVIVGGGLTSAQLAHVACTMGIEVTLLLRGPIKIKHFDFHLDWVTKYKNLKKSSFYILDTDEERAKLITDAREGGSVNPEYHKKLNKHIAEGILTMHQYTTITESTIKDGIWTLMLKTNSPKESCERTIKSDYVVCATGIQADIEGLSFMSEILKEHPIDTVCGLPCLTDNLQWNDALPLYMVGKNAALRIGPTSANLDGARLGAERVGWKIQDDWNKSPETAESTRVQLAVGNYNWYTLLQEA